MTKETPIPLSALSLVKHTEQGRDGEYTFNIEVPTQLMREQLHMRMYELGVIAVTEVAVRALIVNELYEHWPEDVATERADFLANFWDADDAHSVNMANYNEQEIQRLKDQAEGAPKRKPYSEPEMPYTTRERYKAQTFLEEMAQKSRRYRELLARRSDWGRAQQDMLIRLAVKSVVGNAIEVEADEAESVVTILTEQSLENIKVALGGPAHRSLVSFVNSLYSVDQSERKNSGSPAGSEQNPGGSDTTSEGGDETSGSSTTSNIEPAPAGESAMTTGKSSASTSGTKGRTKNTGRTGGRSSTNRSASALQ